MRKSLLALVLLPLLTAFVEDCREGYPAEWWQPVPREGAPAWEVLPQDAGPCEVVLSKRDKGRLELLSNFAATSFIYDGIKYPSIEGFWQMMKYPESESDPRAQSQDLTWIYSRATVAEMVGFAAKHAGDLGSANMKRMQINWVTYRGERYTYRTQAKGRHYHLIKAAMAAKLAQNPEVKAALLATRDLKLIPDHNQGDNPPAAWRYNEIWMDLRSELRNSNEMQ